MTQREELIKKAIEYKNTPGNHLVHNREKSAVELMADFALSLSSPIREIDNTELRNQITELVCDKIINYDGRGKFLSSKLQKIAEKYNSCRLAAHYVQF